MSTETVPRSRSRSRARGVGVVLLVVLLIAGAAGAGWWAGRAALEPRVAVEGPEAGSEVVWGVVSESSVGRSLPLSTTLRQPAVMVAGNGLSGVVTEVSPGAVDVGDAVYVVAGVPVRAVEGAVPFWRDLEPEVEGEDVVQLQGALIELGFLEGVADGEFGVGTERAVKAWQKELGVKETGTVPFGEVVAVPELPTTVQVGESIVVGGTVSGGEEAVLAPTGEREFVLVVTQEQARLIPAEATVRVTWQETVWEAAIAGSSQDEFGSTEFELTGLDGGPVCGGECGSLPGDAQVTLRSEVVVVPEVSGPAVPAAAVQTRADGTAYVITEEGEVEVTVRGSGGGVAIVDGVAEGTRVQVLGEAGDSVPAQPAPGEGVPTVPGEDGSSDTGQVPRSDDGAVTSDGG